MNKFRLILLFSLLCCTNIDCPAQNIDYSNIVPHPRLIMRNGDVENLRSLFKCDTVIMRLHGVISDKANRFMSEPVSVRQKEGRRLLHVSRTVLERVVYCSYMYLITGNESYAYRAENEMLAAAEFADWNPSHFLDVGEMTAALAIGYDWLYDFLSDISRNKISDAIIHKGLMGAESDKQMWFYNSSNNWNQVCNGGLVMGAIAVMEHSPDLTRFIVEKAMKTNPKAMHEYAPDGVYPEGFGYWAYGTWYEVLLIESLRTAFGSSFGIEKSNGFLESADFMNFMVAPSGVYYNFSDSPVTNVSNPLLYWFAIERNDMNVIERERTRIASRDKPIKIESPRMLPFAMLFASRCSLNRRHVDNRVFWSGQGEIPVFVYRNKDIYLAAKGGSPSQSHAHMDGGSFIYEWSGVRWAIDLGSQNYHSLEIRGVKLFAKGQNSPRWSIFRLSNISHNTLTVNDRLHCYDGRADMLETYSDNGRYGARFNLTPILFDVSQAERCITIDADGKVTITDDIISGSKSCNVRWTMATAATPRIINNHTIELTQNGHRLLVQAVSDVEIRAFAFSNEPLHDYDATNPNTCRIGFVVDIQPNCRTVIKVNLEPQR